MDKLISLQAAIDALNDMSKNYEKNGKREYHPHIDFVIDVITMLPSVSTEKTGRWIPVSEKLPEDGIYLVTVERTPGVPRIETKSFAKDLHRVDDYDFPEHKCGWYEYDSEYGYWEDTDVIAWQPLPPCYDPQESEESDADSD